MTVNDEVIFSKIKSANFPAFQSVSRVMVVWWGVVWCSMMRCRVMRCGVVRCGEVWCGEVWCGVV